MSPRNRDTLMVFLFVLATLLSGATFALELTRGNPVTASVALLAGCCAGLSAICVLARLLDGKDGKR